MSDPVSNDRIPVPDRRVVGVVIERRRLDNPWVDHDWHAVQVLTGAPASPPWTALGGDARATRFYVGAAELALYRRETESYRYNLESSAPSVFVVLRRSLDEREVELHAATVCAAEAHAHAEAGDDIVDAVAMPGEIRDWLAAYVEANPPPRPPAKRKRTKADPEALALRAHGGGRLYETDPLRQVPEDE
jgi:hypothetical protein